MKVKIIKIVKAIKLYITTNYYFTRNLFPIFQMFGYLDNILCYVTNCQSVIIIISKPIKNKEAKFIVRVTVSFFVIFKSNRLKNNLNIYIDFSNFGKLVFLKVYLNLHSHHSTYEDSLLNTSQAS